jgi:hypothetical protein
VRRQKTVALQSENCQDVEVSERPGALSGSKHVFPAQLDSFCINDKDLWFAKIPSA